MSCFNIPLILIINIKLSSIVSHFLYNIPSNFSSFYIILYYDNAHRIWFAIIMNLLRLILSHSVPSRTVLFRFVPSYSIMSCSAQTSRPAQISRSAQMSDLCEAILTMLLFVFSYFKFARYGTDAGD